LSAARNIFDKRRSLLAFWLGCAAVTGGVLSHLPMLLMGRHNHYVLAGMPMGAGMIWGMFAIVAGVALAGYGLLPLTPASARGNIEPIAPPENAPLSARHWMVAGLLALALVIDIMKPASLGFVTPGMRAEYSISSATVAWLPFAALAGTAVGSFVWGALADLYGRRGAILLSSVMFIGTSICGAMPSFWWNVAMCFLMGAAAGGMLPVAYALLAEIMPTRHRGWCLVLIGGVGAIGGFFASSGFSALLQPTFGWRVMWLLNFPTGLLLVLMSPWLPESARFLQQMGRADEARAMLARFGAVMAPAEPQTPGNTVRQHASDARAAFGIHGGLFGITVTLTLTALVWSLVNFGVLLWLPSALVAEGQSVAAASALIARSTLIAAPVVLVSAWLYSTWSTKGSLLLMIGITAAGLLGVELRAHGLGLFSNTAFDLTLLIIGSSGMIAILLPYTSENFPLRIRGRATGWVAGCSKLGGLLAQTLSVLGAAPALSAAALGISVPALAAMALLARYGRETRQRDLRELEDEAGDFPPSASHPPPVRATAEGARSLP
jgi:MFS transporter, putative metabolite:H+ symporter